MKSLSGREFARIIERRGWTLLRIKRKSSYLRQEREHRQTLSANTRQQATEDGAIETSCKASRPFGRRPLTELRPERQNHCKQKWGERHDLRIADLHREAGLYRRHDQGGEHGVARYPRRQFRQARGLLVDRDRSAQPGPAHVELQRPQRADEVAR